MGDLMAQGRDISRLGAYEQFIFYKHLYGVDNVEL